MDAKLKDACKAGFLECPSKAGKTNKYHFSLEVSTSYPKVWYYLDSRQYTAYIVLCMKLKKHNLSEKNVSVKRWQKIW